MAFATFAGTITADESDFFTSAESADVRAPFCSFFEEHEATNKAAPIKDNKLFLFMGWFGN
ncbi:hypothetical protein D3C78_1824750 [compost metagenome]